MKLRHLKQFGMLLITSLILTGCQNQVLIHQGVNNLMYNLKDNDEKLINYIDSNVLKNPASLYYDGDVVLIVDGMQITVEEDVEEAFIFGDKLSEKSLYSLYQTDSKIVVAKIQPILKYGERVEIVCYDISDDNIVKMWSGGSFFDDDYENIMTFESINKDDDFAMIDFNNKTYRLNFGQNKEEIYAFLDATDMAFIEPKVIHRYDFQDTNQDGNEELVLEVFVAMGASPLRDTFYATYRFSDNGIEYLDGWFKSDNLEKTEQLNMNNY